MKEKFLIVSCSLNPNSKSRLLAEKAKSILSSEHQVELVDLRDYQLPACDGEESYNHINVKILSKKIEGASCVLMALPIYNYDVNSVAKNLIEMTGQAWNDKVVGFLCAAGGKFGYMSVMGFANSLMLDFRCIIIPRFVYADAEQFSTDGIANSQLVQRIQELTKAALRLSHLTVKDTASAS